MMLTIDKKNRLKSDFDFDAYTRVRVLWSRYTRWRRKYIIIINSPIVILLLLLSSCVRVLYDDTLYTYSVVVVVIIHCRAILRWCSIHIYMGPRYGRNVLCVRRTDSSLVGVPGVFYNLF